MERTRNGLGYMGSKFKLFPWIYNNLPEDIENMKVLDCFGGGGSVSFSLSENYPDIDITYNEFSSEIFRIFNYINTNNKDQILNNYYSINPFLKNKLNKDFETNIEWYDELKTIYKNINKKENPKDNELYFLLYCGFGKRFRSNAGTRVITPRALSNHKNYKNIKTTNCDFRDINFDKYDFLYLDPPYLTSTKSGVYEKNIGYCEDDELSLLIRLENYSGKFMMSNYWTQQLEEWVVKNNFNMLTKKDVKTLGRGNNKETTEILITNY